MMMMMAGLALTLMVRRRVGHKQHVEAGSGGSREVGVLGQLQQQEEEMRWLMRMQAVQVRVAAVQSYQVMAMARVVLGVQRGRKWWSIGGGHTGSRWCSSDTAR
jgi:hypothetical protein